MTQTFRKCHSKNLREFTCLRYIRFQLPTRETNNLLLGKIPFVLDIAKTAIASSNPNCSISANKAGSTRSSLFSGSAGCEQLAPATKVCVNEISGSNGFDATKTVFQNMRLEYEY